MSEQQINKISLEEYKRAEEIVKGYPNPCENSFEYLAQTNPTKLVEWIKSGELGKAGLTFAAEYLGRYTENSDFKTRFKVLSCLMKLLDHESAVVREGAVYGVSYHKVPLTVFKLEAMKFNDPIYGVKEAVRDVLHDWEFDEKENVVSIPQETFSTVNDLVHDVKIDLDDKLTNDETANKK